MRRTKKTVNEDSVVVQLPCKLSAIGEAAETLRTFLESHQCSPSEIMDCRLALVEACNNAVQYACPGARHLPVLFRASCAPSVVELRVTDHTPGFNWPSLTLPTIEAESGRGLFLIRSLMDECHYERGQAENTLVLRKVRLTHNRTHRG